MNTLIYTCCLGLLCLVLEIVNLRRIMVPVVLAGLAVIFGINLMDMDLSGNVIIGGMDMSHMIRVDNFSVAFSGLSIFTAMLIFSLSHDFYKNEQHHLSDYLAILIFILAGALVLFSFTNLVMLFLGIEIVSISLYIMAGSRRNDPKSNEAGFKYFLMGSFASGIMLFGIALLYGASGSFQLDQIAAFANPETSGNLFLIGSLMVIVGLLFKVAAVPFHFWSPDVYEGSPSLVTALMSTLVKVAVFAGFYRLMANGLIGIDSYTDDILILVASLTLIAGNLIALSQNNVKRLLAYSGISHAGYMLMAILSIRSDAGDALLYYGAAYVLATIGAFAVAIPVFQERKNENIDAFNGLGRKNPMMAGLLTMSMLSLAGIPPLAGFMGKYYIFSEAIQSGYIFLTIIAVLASIIGVYYYFKLILAMYTRETTEPVVKAPTAYTIIMIVCVVLSLLFGIFPGLVTEYIF